MHLNAVLGLSIFRCGLLPGIQKSSKTKLCQNRAKKKKKKRKKADAHINVNTFRSAQGTAVVFEFAELDAAKNCAKCGLKSGIFDKNA